jgi:hypothetical protein
MLVCERTLNIFFTRFELGLVYKVFVIGVFWCKTYIFEISNP